MERHFIIDLRLFNYRTPEKPHIIRTVALAGLAREAAAFAFDFSNNPRFSALWDELAPGVRCLSVGDVVRVFDGDKAEYFLCLSVGWESVSEELADRFVRRTLGDQIEINAHFGRNVFTDDHHVYSLWH